jgi:undecaprenyl phosphate-alpha-L-ara4N flippase subunit ArnE
MKTETWAMGLVVLGTIVGSFAPLLLKIGMINKRITIKNLLLNIKVIAGILLYLLSSLFFVIALKGGELSILYPLVSFGYIWVTINSRLFLKEKMDKYKVIGVSFIILGITIITMTN